MYGTRTEKRGVLISLAALSVAVGLAVAVNYLPTRGWRTALTAPAALVIGLLIFRFLDRWNRAAELDAGELREAIGRLGSAYRSLLEYYGTQEPEIGPPVRLRSLDRQQLNAPGLDDFVAKAEQITNQVVIARLARSSNRCTVVLGDAGSGKSALFFRLAAHIVDDYEERGTTEVPLVLSLSDWGGGSPLRRWVQEQAVATYAVSERVVDHWVGHGNSVLLLDGLDEVPVSSRSLLIQDLNSWVDTSGGTRFMISCRSSDDHLTELLSWLHADQLAVLQPIPPNTALGYVDSALSSLERHTGGPNVARWESVRRLLKDLITHEKGLRGPSMLSLVAATEDPVDFTSLGTRNVQDPAESFMSLANRLLVAGDFRAARDAYRACAQIPGSRQRSLATVLYGACEALLGNETAAREAVQESLAVRLNESIQSGDADLRVQSMTRDGRTVLKTMSHGVEYDLSQLSSRSLLTPSRVAEALDSLRASGAVEFCREGEGDVRYRRISSFVVGAE
jgi:DNA-binding transcriptional ArsR family regulator